jgi:prephenate dehydrogenase
MPIRTTETLGIIGFGAFGQLVAHYLKGHFKLYAYDPSAISKEIAADLEVSLTELDSAAQCDIVVIASPVSSFEQVVSAISEVCSSGAIIVDVGSVKVQPSEIMHRLLPDHVDVVATHPLFGPQSACDGIRGLKISICPSKNRRHLVLASFLRRVLGLQVILTSPQEHDREVAIVQGLTHLIARVLSNMEPLPSRHTTRSFDLLIEAISMVQNDAPEVFEAIEKANPYASGVRQQFVKLVSELDVKLDGEKVI